MNANINESEAKAQVIVVTNHKGGCGKTTTVAELGTAFAKLGLEVLVVDLDPQGTCSELLLKKLHPSTLSSTVAEAMLVGVGQLVRAVVNSSLTLTKGLDVLPGDVRLSTFWRDAERAMRPNELLRAQLDRLKTSYDVILIDTPPQLGLLTSNALCAADWYLVPVESGDMFSLHGIKYLLEEIKRVQVVNPGLKPLGALMTSHKGNRKTSQMTEARILGIDEVPTLREERMRMLPPILIENANGEPTPYGIGDTDSIRKAHFKHTTAVLSDSNNLGHRQYMILAKWVMAQLKLKGAHLGQVSDGTAEGDGAAETKGGA